MKNRSFAVGIAAFVISVTATLKTVHAEETFQPYTADNVPRNVADLWGDYDARKEPLESETIREWKTDGIVTRYVTFKIGTFKGTDARIAAYYSFPDNGKKNPAFVWSHGGGQRAERGRGVYFAKQGYATVDINWLGRPMEDDIEVNTDWGNVDPTQGPKFYPKALRKSWKINLQPDEYSLDPVVSPRNSNWFLLAVAARRAITFLEQQPEVDPGRIGFAGYSMGGMVTALTAPDPRLKAVAPFVGGTGFKHIDFPSVERSSLRVHLRDVDLYRQTIDASGYWPLVKCPVVFISSSNDFHAAFERIYRSMALLKHDQWRVTTNIHQNHGPGPEQWVMLNQWFDQYLKGIDQHIPPTPPSKWNVDSDKATLTVTPEDGDRLLETEIYFSYDPNPRTRFWNRADATRSNGSWSATFPTHRDLPLYAFAMCRYKLDHPQQLERGQTTTFVLNSLEHSFLPDAIDLKSLDKLEQPGTIVEDFAHGTRDWSSRDKRSIKTYKLQNPALDRSNEKSLLITVEPNGKRLLLVLNLGSKFLKHGDNLGDFRYTRQIQGDAPQGIRIERSDFEHSDDKEVEWSKIATFEVTLIDLETRQKLELTSSDGRAVLKKIELVH